ncbi:tetraacyldisaccharide 4'-kinase [candidate division WOR-3 bacterium]|nr:tetraacyldisaccharide 4'-kinase [candidate division WOR-3 bacterium]
MLRHLFAPMTIPYFALYSLDRSIKSAKKTKFSRKTIGVGNLEMGGTGKTQFVEYILSLLKKKEIKAAVLARGYGGSHRGLVLPGNRQAGDEVRMLARKFPCFPVLSDKNRKRGFLDLIALYPDIEVVILDDAFQQYGIEKDLDLLLLDWACPKGGGLIPLGNSREPLISSKRADLIVFTRAKSPVLPMDFSKINGTQNIPALFCDFKADKAEKDGVEFPRDTKFFFVSSIARPKSLMLNLIEQGFNIQEHIFFRDHHVFSAKEVEKIMTLSKALNCHEILCTEKDAVKLPFSTVVVRSKIQWLGNSAQVFEKKIEELLQ